MDIYTAVKKEKKNLKIFFISMIIIALILPIAVIITNLTTFFYFAYLGVIEFLIVISMIIRLNYYKVEFKCINNKLMFKTGILTKQYLIICDKVVLVHTNKSDYDLEIIIVTTTNFRNKSLRKVDNNFLKRYPRIKSNLDYLNRVNGEEDRKYYFQIVRRGGLKKYLLLDCIYKNCVKAIYTEQSIQNIKIARGQTIV
ncbi:hypothetical protein [Clostridium sp. SM-530-WT-3G]|uniref:hypothetical protein n=1 Tax=Clostridium sp. SM-530-WT-3G TaxID=2725303 RepID=UPI00145D563C|nr:hypothetical protein [Clostridium sp. SM-530-WT-3G]NME82640.1 hypothetical protein [Clostridium sp. SM-530-WT-3G]